MFRIPAAGGVLPGLVWHYLIGLALGVIFGAAATRIDALRPIGKLRVGLAAFAPLALGIGVLLEVVVFVALRLRGRLLWVAFQREFYEKLPSYSPGG